MTEHDLKGLKNLKVPAPRRRAKDAALRAALDAYDTAGEAKDAEPAKGFPRRARRTHTTSTRPRRRMMTYSRSTYATAASLAALTLFIPAAIFYFDQTQQHRVPAEQQNVGGILDMFGSNGPAAETPSAAREETPVVVAAKPSADLDRARTGNGRIRPPEPAKSQEADLVVANVGGGTVAPTTPPTGIAAQSERRDLRDGLAGSRQVTGILSLGRSNGYAGAPGAPPATVNRRVISELNSVDNAVEGSPVLGFAVVPPPENRDRFDGAAPNPVKQVASEPVSTFSIDVDTSAYSFVRRSLNSGRLPQKDAVRVEELVNYFTYAYPRPESASEPFKPSVTVLPSPWKEDRQLVHIGLKGYELENPERPRANLVFLIDVSGSMASTDKLALLKQGLLMLLDKLRPDDTVGIVTYASGSGVTLEPTKLSEKAKIQSAIERLGAGGSTAGAQGIQDAYRLAGQAFDKQAVNRVILGTDGDFNVGITDQGQLKSFIEEKRKTGIFLSVLGFGQGNYNDALMQALAQNGNGTAAYIDTLSEARKVLIEEASSTLFPIAKDVKIQIEFNPAVVSEYRLIGYETRALRREDFNNDKIDAGDVGSGHSVTAIYEVTPVGAKSKTVDNLRYRQPQVPKPAAVQPNTTLGIDTGSPSVEQGTAGDDQPNIGLPSVGQTEPQELAFLKLRYKLPKEDSSKLLTMPVMKSQALGTIASAPEDVRFAVAVAAFGQLLRGDPWVGRYGYDEIIALANAAKGSDEFGLRSQFVELARLAKALSNQR
ncbi:MAG: VWA domain-containing protein [Alphaproteobacteria bacterium]|nr:VWA domain-containing protein [Alphaproteobacteria bacterium]